MITFKKLNMQVPVFTICYTAANVSNPAGRIATGFPLPSTGRGIEGEGWSHPEPTPFRFFLYQPHPGSRLKTENSPQKPRNITFLHLETTPHHHHRTIANPRGGRARHSVRAAIGIQADKLSRLPLSHCFTEHLKLNTENSPQKPRNITFYILKPRPTITIAPSPTHGAVGRVTPCAPLLASRPTSYPGCHFPIALLNTLKKQIMQVPLLESVPSLRLWPFSSMRSACSPGISSRRLPGLRGHRPRHV